jgi:oxygen-dependent protoporphyrinogen oxidase
MSKVVILGAGITGLSAAYYLEQKGITDILILEATDKAGGKIGTAYEHGFLIEKGPDAFITTKPYGIDLVKEIGLEQNIIHPKTNSFFILKEGQLCQPPAGLRMMVPVDKEAFANSTFFSEEGKQEILNEVNVPAAEDFEDETFESFVVRRFGREMLDYYAEPLFGGIYATPSDEMSMLATFPQLKEMERKYGSLTKAVLEQSANHAPANRSSFISLKNGMQSLVDALLKVLRHTQIQYNTTVRDIHFEEPDHEYRIVMADGRIVKAKEVISTLPSDALQNAVQLSMPEASNYLKLFSNASSYIVTFAFRKEQIGVPMSSTGFVSSKDQSDMVTASTWASAKWEGRAPEGYELIRCFLSKHEALQGKSKEEIIAIAQKEISALMNISIEPAYTWFMHWSISLPQYKLGHADRVKQLKQYFANWPGFHVAGAFLEGVGIPDCIRQGKVIAKAVEV